jgi:hypothetical protein
MNPPAAMESYEGDGVHYRVRAPKVAIDRIRAMLR